MSIHYIKPNVFYVFKYNNIIRVNDSNKYSLDLIIIDNFYKNPDDIRNYALLQNFSETGSFPGYRTKRSFGNNELYQHLKSYLNNIGYNIIFFNMSIHSIGNCKFTYSIASHKAKSWIHKDTIPTDIFDNYNIENSIHMAGIVYLTPNAPFNSGTIFYEFDYENNKNVTDIDKYTFNTTKWKKTDVIGNVYNRMILFNSQKYHSINKLFGTNKYNGRLTYNFFIICTRD